MSHPLLSYFATATLADPAVIKEHQPIPSMTCGRPACRAGHVLCSCRLVKGGV